MLTAYHYSAIGAFHSAGATRGTQDSSSYKHGTCKLVSDPLSKADLIMCQNTRKKICLCTGLQHKAGFSQ